MIRIKQSITSQRKMIALMSLLALGVAYVGTQPVTVVGGMAVAAALASVVLIDGFLSWRKARADAALRRGISDFVRHDAAPSFVSNVDGEIAFRNAAADERFETKDGATLGEVFRDVFASPTSVLFRLQNKAKALGAAREDIVGRKGHMRLSVHKVGTDGYLWRLEEIAERPSGSRGADSLSLPMMTVGKSGSILFMNEAFRRLIGRRVKVLDHVFKELPVSSGQIHMVDTQNGEVQARVTEVTGAGGRSEIYLMPVEGAEPPQLNAARWSFFDALPVPLLKLTPTGHVSLANQSAREFLNHPMKEATHLSELVEGLSSSISDWLEDPSRDGVLNYTKVLRARASSQDTFLQVSLNRVMDNGVPSVVAVLTDATELKTLEAQFVQSQKMQAIGQLAGGVAHDFNNLLTAISGHCDLLLLRHDQGDPDYGDLMQINQNANRAASLVGQLLAFSRKQNLHPEVIDLRDALSDLTHLLNRLVGEKVSLSLTHDPGLFPIRADKRQLEQVLMNLVVNARDAMPDGGEITITTEATTLSTPLKRDRAVVPSGAYVIVKVCDKGTGIEADKLSKVFEPFYTTKRTGEGTGLGLSTAYGIVKQSGGFLFVDSVEGEGTEFTIILPAVDRVVAAEENTPKTKETQVALQGEGVVLLVEDEAPVRAFASRALRMRGYTVVEAECAEDALEKLEDASFEVDIFVTDVIMPGMDGPSWVKKALLDRPDTKVVFVSGYAEDSFADDQASIPNSVFLPKPFSLNDLTATVHDQLH